MLKKNIKNLRLKTGITKYQFSKGSDISEKMVSKLKVGKTTDPKKIPLIALVKELNDLYKNEGLKNMTKDESYLYDYCNLFNLKRSMKFNHITIDDLCNKTNISLNDICKNISIEDILNEFAKILGVNTGFLLYGKTDGLSEEFATYINEWKFWGGATSVGRVTYLVK